MFKSLSKQEKEAKLQQEKEEKFNMLVKSYNHAVEIKSPEHHKLAVEVAEAYKSLNYKESSKKSFSKQDFIDFLKIIKKWSENKLSNRKKLEELSEEQTNKYNSLIKEYKESCKVLDTRRGGEFLTEDNNRYHKASQELAEFYARYVHNRY